jgi:nitrite reductase/ring-hydroxylating ferredoxin subunit
VLFVYPGDGYHGLTLLCSHAVCPMELLDGSRLSLTVSGNTKAGDLSPA